MRCSHPVKNPKLAQAISDVSWGEITRQLAYKCRWYGRNYREIDIAFLIHTRYIPEPEQLNQ
ncbi:Genome sequencing data, contig C326 (fragment) [Microcystis aeruginosa PCC 9717]|uniref:Genome sequencing data, contig C326 n=1 Tax=Microcystis aeruginosa PCC 9717 TaxID=1160286 RepID=I4FVN7_MICAE